MPGNGLTRLTLGLTEVHAPLTFLALPECVWRPFHAVERRSPFPYARYKYQSYW